MEALFAKYGNMVLILLVWVAIFYFLIIRPSQKRKKDHQNLVSSLKEGSEVVTIGGIKGTVAFIGEDYIELKVDKNVRMTFLKSAISRVINS